MATARETAEETLVLTGEPSDKPVSDRSKSPKLKAILTSPIAIVGIGISMILGTGIGLYMFRSSSAETQNLSKAEPQKKFVAPSLLKKWRPGAFSMLGGVQAPPLNYFPGSNDTIRAEFRFGSQVSITRDSNQKLSYTDSASIVEFNAAVFDTDVEALECFNTFAARIAAEEDTRLKDYGEGRAKFLKRKRLEEQSEANKTIMVYYLVTLGRPGNRPIVTVTSSSDPTLPMRFLKDAKL